MSEPTPKWRAGGLRHQWVQRAFDRRWQIVLTPVLIGGEARWEAEVDIRGRGTWLLYRGSLTAAWRAAQEVLA